ncbi:hypothetical protein DL770_011570 [Monosporascus sp. CRB-9-2]|nr:hypothetical protein DL770_011570 [Monosporascus sp. CRB-9-2]
MLALSGVPLMNDYANGGNPEAERFVHTLFKGSRRTNWTKEDATRTLRAQAFANIILPSSITVCPIVFNVPRGIRGVQPNPVRKQDVNAGRVGSAQQIGDLLPTTTTLFREIFHLVLGSWDIKPA